MLLYKKYIEVVALINKVGDLTPLFIIWDNNIKYPIDKIIEVRKAHSTVGGSGILYVCKINGQTRRLFYERYRWFIESYKP